jgi:hypothetical protein
MKNPSKIAGSAREPRGLPRFHAALPWKQPRRARRRRRDREVYTGVRRADRLSSTRDGVRSACEIVDVL